MNDMQAIILAAGKSTRFNTTTTKMITPICGKPMIFYTLDLCKQLDLPITLVVGHQKENLIQAVVENNYACSFVTQEEQRGTGDALKITQSSWQKDNLLVVNGDVPLITPQMIEKLYAEHIKIDATITFAIAHHDQPSASYGRVFDNPIRIVEARHFDQRDDNYPWINAGIYLIKKEFLEKHIAHIQKNKNSNEFYITDLIEHASVQQEKIGMVYVDFQHVRGINTISELSVVERNHYQTIAQQWLDNDIFIKDPQTTLIDTNVVIGAGTTIEPGVQIKGNSIIGRDCTVGAYTIISNSIIKDNATIGPFAHVHTNSVLNENVCIGNFVEVKNSTIDAGTKAKHLTYLGDSTIGAKTNIGAGTITCNYDGKNKHRTIIGNQVFIGSNNSLIAPVTIKDNAMTAAGSTITNDVDEFTLAIARARQINKDGYVLHLKQRQEKIKTTETQ